MLIEKNKEKNEQRSTRLLEIKKGLFYVVILLIIFSLFLFFGYVYNQKSNYEKLANAQFSVLEGVEKSLQNDMEINSQRLLIFNMNSLIEYLLLEYNPDNKEILNDMFFEYVKEIEGIDRIRLIDTDGMEIVRVDKDRDGNAKIIPEEQLQDKSERYYYKDIMKQYSDDIYISLSDLKAKYSEIGGLQKQKIRIGKRIKSENGDILGMIVIDVLGQDVLHNIKEMASDEYIDAFMLDENGYYLYANVKEKEYEFMSVHEEKVGFFSDYKEVWNQIKNGETEIISKDSRFYVKKIKCLDSQINKINDNHPYIVLSLSNEAIKKNDKQIIDTIKYAIILFVPIIALFGWSFGVNRVRKKVYKEKLEVNANIDSLTGLYNHRKTICHLSELVKISRRKNEGLAVLFIDINNLKYVNDNLGHKMGDVMIIGAANSLSSSVRKTDFVARLGGDEFLVIMPDCKEEDALKIMKRALEKFSNIGMKEANSKWVMSYGYAQLKPGESSGELMQRADKLMYQNKKITKERDNILKK